MKIRAWKIQYQYKTSSTSDDHASKTHDETNRDMFEI